MIILYYHDALEQIGPRIDQALPGWLAAWPASVVERVERRRVLDDRRRAALGWRLLELHLQAGGGRGLASAGVDYPASGKPRCDAGLDFNISHSGSLVGCAVSDEGRIGLDVERVRAVSKVSWRRYLTEIERARVASDPAALFDLWTRKEAVVKARGQAGIADVPKVVLQGQQARLHGERWYLLPVELRTDYAACLAAETQPRALVLRRVTDLEVGAGLASRPGASLESVFGQVAPEPPGQP
ncbi:MAG TPA: 4'-phosphopantetheinyl transferase superfamily protein [Gammaproteobacteria bacterium]|nr:4'-phosphopantetheinyl transferase superfamily protein [Gammaproteobacteria bacterium]